MKAVGCVVLVVVAGFAGLFALAGWLITSSGDQSDLTRRVTAVVLGEPDRVGQAPTASWKFDYAYEVDGQWYGPTDEGDLKDEPVAAPGEPVAVTVCVDPRDPARHALQSVGACGEELVNTASTDEATPRPAP